MVCLSTTASTGSFETYSTNLSQLVAQMLLHQQSIQLTRVGGRVVGGKEGGREEGREGEREGREGGGGRWRRGRNTNGPLL